MGAVVSSAVYLYLPADLYLFFQLASWKLLTYITQNYVHNGEKLADADKTRPSSHVLVLFVNRGTAMQSTADLYYRKRCPQRRKADLNRENEVCNEEKLAKDFLILAYPINSDLI